MIEMNILCGPLEEAIVDQSIMNAIDDDLIDKIHVFFNGSEPTQITHKKLLTYHSETNIGICKARNTMLQHTNEDVLQLDGDILYVTGVSRILRNFLDQGYDAVTYLYWNNSDLLGFDGLMTKDMNEATFTFDGSFEIVRERFWSLGFTLIRHQWFKYLYPIKYAFGQAGWGYEDDLICMLNGLEKNIVVANKDNKIYHNKMNSLNYLGKDYFQKMELIRFADLCKIVNEKMQNDQANDQKIIIS